MKNIPLALLLFLSSFSATGISYAYAQNRGTGNPTKESVVPGNTHNYGSPTKESVVPMANSVPWQTYDSLGDDYLFNGDTTMALYNYQRAIELGLESDYDKRSYQKIKKIYQRNAASFYLKDY